MPSEAASSPRRIPWLLLFALLLAGFTLAKIAPLSSVQSSDELARASAPPGAVKALRVETVSVKPERGYRQARLFTGRVEARRSSALGFELAGRVSELLVDEGDQVEADEVLARLDRQRLQARRAELIAALTEARANRDLARASLRRAERVVAQGGVSRQGLDEAREADRAARAGVALASARLDTVDVELVKSELRAPFAGVVIRREVDEGQVVNAGALILALQSLEPPQARIGIAGPFADALEVGEALRLQLIGSPLEFEARVRAVLPLRASITQTVDVLFDLEPGLRAGDLVRLELSEWVERPGFWLPISALTEGAHGVWAAYVAEPGSNLEVIEATHTLKPRRLELIYQNEERVYVRGAISADEQVVANGTHRVVARQQVRVVP